MSYSPTVRFLVFHLCLVKPPLLCIPWFSSRVLPSLGASLLRFHVRLRSSQFLLFSGPYFWISASCPSWICLFLSLCFFCLHKQYQTEPALLLVSGSYSLCCHWHTVFNNDSPTTASSKHCKCAIVRQAKPSPDDYYSYCHWLPAQCKACKKSPEVTNSFLAAPCKYIMLVKPSHHWKPAVNRQEES